MFILVACGHEDKKVVTAGSSNPVVTASKKLMDTLVNQTRITVTAKVVTCKMESSIFWAAR